MTSLIKEYDNFTRFNISSFYKDSIGKIFFFFFLQGENESTWTSQLVSRYYVQWQKQKVLTFITSQKQAGYTKKNFEISASEGQRNICLSRDRSYLIGAQNLKTNTKAIPVVFTVTFCSPIQEVLKNYRFQPSSQTFFVKLTLLPYKQLTLQAQTPIF